MFIGRSADQGRKRPIDVTRDVYGAARLIQRDPPLVGDELRLCGAARQQETQLNLKDKGRCDYTLTSPIPGPSSGVHFSSRLFAALL
jgi:hypothetical protein